MAKAKDVKEKESSSSDDEVSNASASRSNVNLDGTVDPNSSKGDLKHSKRYKSQSTHADSAFSNNSTENGEFGKTVIDTTVRRILYMKLTIASIISNTMYMVAIFLIYRPEGLTLPFSVHIFKNYAPLILQVWGIICYFLIAESMDAAMAAFCGYLISRPEGYSVAVCGYIHSAFSKKLSFPSTLSFKSPAKKILERVNVIYFMQAFLIIMTIVNATAVTTLESSIDGESKLCREYGQAKTPYDRGIPTVENTLGVAEVIEGSALGEMSYLNQASDGSFEESRFIMPPQITEKSEDGTAIAGAGFVATVNSHCKCTRYLAAQGLQAAGVPASKVNSTITAINGLDNNPGWVKSIAFQDSEILITDVLVGTKLCKGFHLSRKVYPVCTTRVTKHEKAFVKVVFMSDGESASVTSKQAIELENMGPANMTYFYEAIKIFLGLQVPNSVMSTTLPPHTPGLYNPIFWTMSKNSNGIAPGLVETGMERATSLLLRGAIQRSYSVKGTKCESIVHDITSVTITIAYYGYQFGIIWACFQQLINLLCLIAFVPWFLSDVPILPTVMVAREYLIFSMTAAKNPSINSRVKAMGSNIETDMVWNLLDVVLRHGESSFTADDPERGVIVLDIPEKVTNLSYFKLYI